MDTPRGFEQAGSPPAHEPADGGVGEPMLVGGDERRMHVRAYNYWVSLLKGRAYPGIEDLDPANIADFGAHSVLLDFTGGIEDPAIAFLGRALREECALDQSISRIAQVPARSLLSRLTDHYLQIIANRAPIGFEAEFVNARGHTTMYRGILMPFSSDDDAIDFIYGVINWKEVVDPATQARLDAELAAAVRAAPRSDGAAAAAVWADGPSADGAGEAAAGTLADQLALARETAASARAADQRSRAALYRALGRAWDFALAADADAEGYAAVLAEAGITAQARAPMTAVAKLVFGAGYDKTRLTEFAAVLSHARRHAVPAGELVALIESHAGGIKAIVALERAARRPAPRPAAAPKPRPTLATLPLDPPVAAGELVVLVARATGAGTVEVLGAVADARLAARASAALG